MVRDQSARVIINGIHGTDGGFESVDLSLYNADSFSVESDTQTNQQSIPGGGDDEAVLAPVSGSRSVRLSGQTSFSRVSGGFPSLDKKESLRTWLRSLESLILPQQGLGWEVEDSVRGLTYDPTSNRGILFEDVSWSYSPGDGERFDWTVQGQFSEGVQNRDSPDEYVERRGFSDVQTDKLVTDGLDVEFSYVENRNVDRTTNIQSTDLIHQLEEEQGDSPVLGTIDQGVTTEVSFDGTIYEPDTFQGTIQDFDRELQGSKAELFDMFSGTVWEGTISSSDTSIESGRPNRFDFSVTLEVGQVLG